MSAALKFLVGAYILITRFFLFNLPISLSDVLHMSLKREISVQFFNSYRKHVACIIRDAKTSFILSDLCCKVVPTKSINFKK